MKRITMILAVAMAAAGLYGADATTRPTSKPSTQKAATGPAMSYQVILDANADTISGPASVEGDAKVDEISRPQLAGTHRHIIVVAVLGQMGGKDVTELPHRKDGGSQKCLMFFDVPDEPKFKVGDKIHIKGQVTSAFWSHRAFDKNGHEMASNAVRSVSLGMSQVEVSAK